MDTPNSQPPATPSEDAQANLLRPQYVSVIDPIGPAIEHVRLMLFRPFDLSKWLIIGFCAWLAYLGQGGGGGQGFNNFNFGDGRHHPGSWGSDLPAIKDAILPYLPLIIIGGIALVIFVFLIGLVLCWLRSRGQFMFVHCIAGNKAEVGVPWNKYSRHGNSLFLFKLVLSIISLVVIAIPIVILIIAIIALAGGGFCVGGIMGIIGAGFAVFIISIVLGLIAKFTDDFVVPIMFTQTASVMAGWRQCLAMLGCNKGRMALYILFQIVIAMVIGIIATLICLIGCCCCCISALLFVPYIGTVILLPLFAFKRSYSLFYLRQFGPQFDVFNQPANIPVAAPMAPNP